MLGSLLVTLGLSTSFAFSKPPNIVVVMADDLGYSDLGCYGSEIATPNLDRLAEGGLRFTQFTNTARCWPTRAALLTGYYAQQVRRDQLDGIKSGNKGERPKWATLLPEKLKQQNYRCYHSGKWHVDGTPNEGGFDRSYNLGDHSYFAPKKHFENETALPAVNVTDGYYSTVAIADYAIRCLQDHAVSHADQPFFEYIAFFAPHFPLHALPEDIAKYADTYRVGWDEIRKQRWAKQQALGIARGSLSEVEYDIGPPYDFPDDIERLGPGEVNHPKVWKDLTKVQQDFQATKMAIHAAMIDRIDKELGRVIEQLESSQELDNTLFFFLSDNGASAEIMVRGGGHDPTAVLGSDKSYLCLGPGWSTVSNTPFRRHKTWVHSGGVATPLIVHWPEGITAKNQLRHNSGHVIDIVPTVLDAIGMLSHTQQSSTAPAVPGKSLLPVFAEDGSVEHPFLWWLHEGNRAIRIGQWRLVAAKDKPWELFNLANDPNETRNLADQFPDRAEEMANAWTEHLATFTSDAKDERE